MPNLADLQIVSDSLAIWHVFDRSVKADLFSTALSTSDGTFLVDPIPLPQPALDQLQASSPIRAIVITSQNHWRASFDIASKLSIPIFAHPAARLPDQPDEFSAVADGHKLAPGLEIITIEGAAPGEIALFWQPDRGTLIVGDALINFEPYGFTFLPPKYCEDQRKMKQSLRRLTSFRIERIFFAHGFPILARAGSRLEGLLNE